MPTHRCRLCTSNDRDGLVEELAERLWECRRDREIDFTWAECGSYWQSTFRQFAGEAIGLLQHGHL